MNKYYEAIRLVEDKLYTLTEWKEGELKYSIGSQEITRAIEILYELYDLYIKERTKVVYK